jgi:AcrR family transcriptional regulator
MIAVDRRVLRFVPIVAESSPYSNTSLACHLEEVVARRNDSPLRADARLNRDRILQVAHEAFAQSGDASLNYIAKRANVGAGTLYRHFPTREALILAVYRRDIQQLVESVPTLLAEHAPLIGMRLWFERLAGYVKIKHGLGDALNAAAVQDVINETYAPVTAAVGELLAACEQAGSVRPGLDPGDVLLLMGFLWRVGPGEQGAAQASRLLDLVIDSLRAEPTTTTRWQH